MIAAARVCSAAASAAFSTWRDGQDRGSCPTPVGWLPPTSVAGGGFNNEITVNQPEMFHVGLQTMPTVTPLPMSQAHTPWVPA